LTRASVIDHSHIFLGVLVGLLALVGITSIGIVDLIFFERMMVSNVVEAAKLERENSWLPALYSKTISNEWGRSTPRKSLFYIGCGNCLVILMGILCGVISGVQGFWQILTTSLSITFASLLYATLFYGMAGQSESLAERLLGGVDE